MNSVKEAAERRRTLTYHGMGKWRTPSGESLDAEDVAALDADLAQEYLREHDETPVTAEALLAMGFEQTGYEGFPIYCSPRSTRVGPVFRIEWESMMGCDAWRDSDSGSLFANMETLGEVRMFCKAMGIELREEKA